MYAEPFEIIKKKKKKPNSVIFPDIYRKISLLTITTWQAAQTKLEVPLFHLQSK